MAFQLISNCENCRFRTSGNKNQDKITEKKGDRPEKGNTPLSSAGAESKTTAKTEHHHKSAKTHQHTSAASATATPGGSKSKVASTIDTTASGTAMSSSNAGVPGGGKAGGKLAAIDHQATLDKGLKMKIKRTKPGTKTSEAKHEIVKAEQQQNGALSAANDDSNSSSSGSSNGNKKSITQSSPLSAAQTLSGNGNGASGAVSSVSDAKDPNYIHSSLFTHRIFSSHSKHNRIRRHKRHSHSKSHLVRL